VFFFFFLGGGGGAVEVLYKLFCKNSRGPPTFQSGLMHDPSQIPTQKHLTLPHLLQAKNNRR